MSDNLTYKMSKLAGNTTQNVSDAVSTGTQIASDMSVGISEYASVKTDAITNDISNKVSDFVQKNGNAGIEDIAVAASGMTVAGNLEALSSGPEDKTGTDRLNKFGDPSAQVHDDSEDEDDVFPRSRRVHHHANKKCW